MAKQRNIRLYLDTKLQENAVVSLSSDDSHYLCNVMRCVNGNQIKCFNENDGEFLCEITNSNKKQTMLSVKNKLRLPNPEADVWLIFAPLKKDKTDFVIEKAVELGVSKIIPVYTEYTNLSHIKTDRFRAQAKEASEQCERLSVPEIASPLKLDELLNGWDASRQLFFMDERRNGASVIENFTKSQGKPCALLIGPEGGFSENETQKLNSQAFVKNICLGPRILRAETAAVAALAVWQATAGDWHNKEK